MPPFGLTGLQFEILVAVLGVIAAFILAKVINYVFARILRRVAAKTKTTADDRFVNNVQKPVTIFAILIGIHFGLKYITMFGPYGSIIDMAITIAYIFVAARIAVEVFDLMFALYLEKIAAHTKTEVDNQITPIIRNIMKALIYVVAVIFVLGKLGYDIGPMLAGLGIMGLAIALALQSTLASFFAGFYILADKPVRKGDFVRLSSGEDGHIVSIGWRSTRIRALKNYIIVVPNTKLVETIIYNYNLPQKEMSIVTKIGVDYKSNVDKVEKIIREEAKKAQKKFKGTIDDFEPTVRFDDFSDFSLDFVAILRIKSYTDQWSVAGQFKKNLFQRFKKERISVPFPTQTIFVEK